MQGVPDAATNRKDAVSTSVNSYPSAVGAAAEHPADPKIVGPSTDPQVLEQGPIINAPVADPVAPAEFKFVDAVGKEHESAGVAAEASVPSKPKGEDANK